MWKPTLSVGTWEFYRMGMDPWGDADRQKVPREQGDWNYERQAY